jgi:hypothetical protein
MVLQQKRSALRAHARRRMFREGDEGGEGDASVAMLSRQAAQGMRRGGRRREEYCLEQRSKVASIHGACAYAEAAKRATADEFRRGFRDDRSAAGRELC